MKPLARSNQLVVEKVGDETVVYDSHSKKAHNLNPVVSWIWRHCDGSKDVAALSTGVEKEFGSKNARGVVLEALQQLETANLLTAADAKTAPKAKTISRRAAAAGVGAALVPAVASIMVPRAAAAASGTPKKKKKKKG